jgi:hypothetical protein
MPDDSFGTLPRRSERVLLRIPIRVEGKDIVGNAFQETTYTQVVNRSGGLIVVSHLLQPGAVIRITNPTSHVPCSFQVVTRATRSLSGAPEWGVKCLKPELDIWGVHFPTRAEEPPRAHLVYVLLECQACFSREMAPLTAQQYQTLAAESSLPRPCPKCSAQGIGNVRSSKLKLTKSYRAFRRPLLSGLLRGAKPRSADISAWR